MPTYEFSAFIFCCTNSTEAEWLQRGLFGGPASLSNQKVEQILPGTHCYYTIQKVRSY